ncbi:MAG: hypothetical protein K8S15_05740 [Candidatus Aegiribacteria sp.]|nr:hypothetical protein [Candidatus Aegiribacteria sp.]
MFRLLWAGLNSLYDSPEPDERRTDYENFVEKKYTITDFPDIRFSGLCGYPYEQRLRNPADNFGNDCRVTSE